MCYALQRKEEEQVRCISNIECRTRDDVVLATDIYLPDIQGIFPFVLFRTPYGKKASYMILFMDSSQN
jgi:predicted acyl esterase